MREMGGLVLQLWGVESLRIAYAGSDLPDLELSTPVRGAPTDGAPTKAVLYRTLFDEYWPRVRRHVACFIDNSEEVDEIAAEVFVVAWRKLNPAKPMGLRWFLRVADNKLRDVMRRSQSRTRAIEAMTRGMQASEELHPLEALALRQALQSLNARERQVVVLTYWDGLSAGEVSDVLRSSEAAVWTTLTRARQKLRGQLEAKEADA
ncbi:RNA polymerase sigma factor CnrH [Microbacterium foliorum]|uniref:RNA polymerase sigma factor n=2 Tax=Microbacterium foliorum TaxID=104336 RepID=UPI001DCE3373|nr:sigma-70 family RNA polymerase sigma factor [Microbacterium foliorum]CAH0184152.1 RNA polymerase sigma factor CnrH [Microbacterium foliorum]CAH0223912.1 RNA polymerase sigma factor CnrH [Microbacterium foliorum]